MLTRLEEFARRLGVVERELERDRPQVLATKIEALEGDVRELTGEVRGLRRAVIGFAITVAASAVGLAITVVIVSGGGAT